MKLSKYWNRQHKSLYRFLNIFEHDKLGRKWRLDKVHEGPFHLISTPPYGRVFLKGLQDFGNFWGCYSKIPVISEGI
jgi:hypothetical protein